MDISDLDIYDDLDEFQQKEEKKSAEILTLEAKYKESLETIELMKVEMKTLRKKHRIMEVNFQNLLDTAKTELKRKNDQIAQLQREKDDICFRRKNAGSSVAARARHKTFGDGADSVTGLAQHQQANPFKQNAAPTVPPHLEYETALSKTEKAASQLPTEQLATTTCYKRQLSPIDSDESLKEADNVGPTEKTLLHKKPRYEEQKTQHRAHSNSDKDEASMCSRRRERSHSRERKHKSNTDASNSSRHRYNKSQRGSDTEDRYSDYQRERRRERESEYENYHDRHLRTSREGRQRQRHDSNHYRRHRKASRSDLERIEKPQNSKKSFETCKRLSPRKESLHKTLDAHESSKESNEKSFNKKHERHENAYEKKAQTKERTETTKKVIALEQKDDNHTFLEKYKIPKKDHKEKPLKRDSKEASLNSSKHCITADDYKDDDTEKHALSNASIVRNSKQCKNNIDGHVVLDIDEEIADLNHSNSSTDTIIFDITKDTDIKNSSNKMNNDVPKEQSNDTLSTPKKVALFEALFGQQAADGTTTNISSKLLNNVLEILKNDANKVSLSTDTKRNKDDEVLSTDLLKKQNDVKTIAAKAKENDSSDTCLLETPKSSKLITQSSTKNMEMAKNVSKPINKQSKDSTVTSAKAENDINQNEVIEIADDTDIDSTDEEIVFFNIEAPTKHSDKITKPASTDLEKLTASDSSAQVAKGDKTKKPVIEIIEDIRLPAVLPIKQILKIHEKTSAQQQQVIANKITENLPLLLEDGELEMKDNVEYSSNITVFNTDNELDISDQTDIVFDETNMSLEVVSDEEILDLEDKQEIKAQSLTKAKTNSEQTNNLLTENVTTKKIDTAEQEKSLLNNTNELKKVECVINMEVQPEKVAGAFVYLDIDEDCAEKEKHEQLEENPELLHQTDKIHNKQEITLSTKEKTNKAIDSNINTFDIQADKEKPASLMDKVVPVDDISADIKVTLNKKDSSATNVTDVKLLAEPIVQTKSFIKTKKEIDELLIITSNDEQLPDVISVKHRSLSKVAVENHVDENKIIISDEKNSVIDQLQNADKLSKHSPPHAAVNSIISDDQEILVDVTQEIIHNSIENLPINDDGEKMELTKMELSNEQSKDITTSLDKIEDIVEVEKRETKLQQELKDKNGSEKNIKITSDQDEDATKDANIFESNEVICDKLQTEVAEANLNNTIHDKSEETPETQEQISNIANISNPYTENHEEIEFEILSENNSHKEEEEVKTTNETDEDTVTNIEMEAIEVGLIEVEADIKELEVDLQIYENDNNNAKKTQQPEVLLNNSNEDDVIMPKFTLNDNDELSERTNIIPENHDITLNKEFQDEFKAVSRNESCQNYSRHIVQDDRRTKLLEKEHKEAKAYESFKKCVASVDRKATSKSKSKVAAEEHNNCSEISTENLNEAGNANNNITTFIETSKTELILSAKDQRGDNKHQIKLLIQGENLPAVKQSNESIPKVIQEDEKTGQEISLNSSNDSKNLAHEVDKKEYNIKTPEINQNKLIEHEIKTTEPSQGSNAKDEPHLTDVKAFKNIDSKELEQNTRIQELAINQLRALSAIDNPDGKYYTSSEEERCFSPKELQRQSRDESVKEKQPRYNSPASTKNYFKILVAPRVEDRKRKLSDGYKIPKLKQPKLDIIDETKNDTKNATKSIAATYKDHKENFLNKKKDESNAEKIFPMVKNSTKTNSSRTASFSKNTVKKSNFSEVDDKLNIPNNNNNNHSSTTFMEQKKNSSNLETKPLIQAHKLEICDPRNPLYSTMDNIRVNKIKQKVNEKLLKTQVLFGDNENQAEEMSTANINNNSHSELKPPTNNIKSKVLPNMQNLASTASSTNSNQTKSKHFRRILDSSSGDEISDEQNINRIDSLRLNAKQLQATTANHITPNREPKRKRTKRRVVRVTTIGEATKTMQHEISAPPTPPAPPPQSAPPMPPAPSVPPASIRVPPTPIRAPPTPDHAIFHTEPESSFLYAASALPQFNNLQDKQYTDIDSRLQSMFQSPPYVADQQVQISKNLLSPIQHEATSMSPTMEQQTSLNDSSSKIANNLETKRLSLGTSQYLVEKVSENVVNVFITRKRHKKKSTLLNNNNTAKPPELLTSMNGEGIV